jgi:membrane protein required for colicin V production
MNIYVDVGVSLFDFLIAAVLLWAMWRGYKRGAIIHSVALLVLLAGIMISAKLSYLLYDYLSERSRVPLINFPVIFFAILFIPIVVGSHHTANKVTANVGPEPKGLINKLLGIAVNFVKYLFMISIVLIFIYKIDASHDFINKNERKRTILFYPVLSVAPRAFNILTFPENHPVPLGKPEEIKKKEGVNLDDF